MCLLISEHKIIDTTNYNDKQTGSTSGQNLHMRTPQYDDSSSPFYSAMERAPRRVRNNPITSEKEKGLVLTNEYLHGFGGRRASNSGTPRCYCPL